jgi:hypothetical protein
MPTSLELVLDRFQLRRSRFEMVMRLGQKRPPESEGT